MKRFLSAFIALVGLAWGVIAMGLGIGGLYVGWLLTVYLFHQAVAFVSGLF